MWQSSHRQVLFHGLIGQLVCQLLPATHVFQMKSRCSLGQHSPRTHARTYTGIALYRQPTTSVATAEVTKRLLEIKSLRRMVDNVVVERLGSCEFKILRSLPAPPAVIGPCLLMRKVAGVEGGGAWLWE